MSDTELVVDDYRLSWASGNWTVTHRHKSDHKKAKGDEVDSFVGYYGTLAAAATYGILRDTLTRQGIADAEKIAEVCRSTERRLYDALWKAHEACRRAERGIVDDPHARAGKDPLPPPQSDVKPTRKKTRTVQAPGPARSAVGRGSPLRASPTRRRVTSVTEWPE